MVKTANESNHNSHKTKSEEDETKRSTLWEWLVEERPAFRPPRYTREKEKQQTGEKTAHQAFGGVNERRRRINERGRVV